MATNEAKTKSTISIMITIYRHFGETLQPNYRHINAILARIRDGKSAIPVNFARDCYGDEVAYSAAKKRLPCILFSGRFNRRSIDGLIEHSGFICLDFDKFTDPEELALWRDNLDADEYTYSVFTSPSGRGLKCVVKIPPEVENHKGYFRGLQAYYNCQYFDPNVFDVSRICFESYDPSLVINPASSTWMGYIADPEPINVEYGKASLGEVETARRLLKWWTGKFGIANGNRNNNLFKLCAALNDYGIDIEHARSIVHGYQQNDFKLSEIETTLKSAYKKTSKHGTLSF
jgi:hypothetical protein